MRGSALILVVALLVDLSATAVAADGSRKQAERRPAFGASACPGSVRSIMSTATGPWPYIPAAIAILALVHFAGGHVRH